jgi:hypothetical protein
MKIAKRKITSCRKAAGQSADEGELEGYTTQRHSEGQQPRSTPRPPNPRLTLTSRQAGQFRLFAL